jgi:Domain of unknown function (DUF222)/HNH endonuclease
MFETESRRLIALGTKLAQLPPDGLDTVSDPALKDLVADCCEATSAVQAITATVVGEWDRRQLWVHDGATSPEAWLRRRGELEHTKPLVHTARVLRDHAPATAAALADGTISYEKAAAIATAVRTDATPQLAAALAAAFAADEAQLVGDARRMTIAETRTKIDHWRTTTLAALGDDPHQRLQARRELQLWRTRDGLVGFKGYLGPDEGPAVAAVLEAKANQLWHADVRAAKAAAGLADRDDNHVPDGLTLARTGPQRLADGLCELLLAGASETAQQRDTTAIGGPAAVLHVMVGADTVIHAAAQRVRATLEIPGLDPVDRADLEAALAVLPATHLARRLLEGPVPALDGWDRPPDLATIGLLACDCTLQRIILDAAGYPLDVGREQRLATPAQRRALIVRDGGCAFPDCDRPPRWCDAHHIIPYELLGPTNLANLVLLCRRHHRKLHAKQPWRCRINPHTRLPEFFDPDGNHVPKHPPPRAKPQGARPDQPSGTHPSGPPREFRRVA